LEILVGDFHKVHLCLSFLLYSLGLIVSQAQVDNHSLASLLSFLLAANCRLVAVADSASIDRLDCWNFALNDWLISSEGNGVSVLAREVKPSDSRHFELLLLADSLLRASVAVEAVYETVVAIQTLKCNIPCSSAVSAKHLLRVLDCCLLFLLFPSLFPSSFLSVGRLLFLLFQEDHRSQVGFVGLLDLAALIIALKVDFLPLCFVLLLLIMISVKPA
jgi:hypothetical protein